MKVKLITYVRIFNNIRRVKILYYYSWVPLRNNCKYKWLSIIIPSYMFVWFIVTIIRL